MACHLKAFGKVRLELNAAAGHLEDLAALVAAKMMVMLLARNFVARRLSRQSDRDQPLLFHQSADIAINGCNADAFHQLSGVAQRFFRRKRPIRAQKRRTNGVFLPRLSCLHDQSLPSSLESPIRKPCQPLRRAHRGTEKPPDKHRGQSVNRSRTAPTESIPLMRRNSS